MASEGLRRVATGAAGVAIEAQRALTASVGGDAAWNLDVATGGLDLGPLRVRASLLATAADDERTWLWAWANEASDLPPELVASGLRARELGTAEGVPELVEPLWPLDDLDVLLVMVVCCGALGSEGWWLGGYPGGTAALLVHDPLLRRPAAALEVVGAITGAIGTLDLDHRSMVRAYAGARGSVGVDEPGRLVVTVAGDEVVVTFDELGRVAQVTTTATPPRT